MEEHLSKHPFPPPTKASKRVHVCRDTYLSPLADIKKEGHLRDKTTFLPMGQAGLSSGRTTLLRECALIHVPWVIEGICAYGCPKTYTYRTETRASLIGNDNFAEKILQMYHYN